MEKHLSITLLCYGADLTYFIFSVINYSLDIESFEKMVDRLGADHVTYGLTPPGLGRETSKMTNTPSIGPTTISQSRLATAGTTTRKTKEVRIDFSILDLNIINLNLQHMQSWRGNSDCL